MKRNNLQHQKKTAKPAAISADTSTITKQDRELFAQLLQALPTFLLQGDGTLPKKDAVAELLGISSRIFTEVLAARYNRPALFTVIHAALTRDCPTAKQKLHHIIRQAIRLDEFLHKYFPALKDAGILSAGKGGSFTDSAVPSTSRTRQANLSPDKLRLFAFAQGLDAAAQQKLESVFACSSSPSILEAKFRLAESIKIAKETLDAFCRPIAHGARRPLENIRAHVHVLGSAFNRSSNATAPALLPFAYFSMVRSLDSEQPVFLEVDWYSIVRCVRAERTIVHTINLKKRPDTAEAIEVPAIECVVAHPLRDPDTRRVFGVLSFDCIAAAESQANPTKALKALDWGEPGSEHPSAHTKSMMQQLGSSMTRQLLKENLNGLLAGHP